MTLFLLHPMFYINYFKLWMKNSFNWEKMIASLCFWRWLWCFLVHPKWDGYYLAGLQIAQRWLMQLCLLGTQVFNTVTDSWPITTSFVDFFANGWGRNDPPSLCVQRASNETKAVVMQAFRIMVQKGVYNLRIGRHEGWTTKLVFLWLHWFLGF